MPDKKDIEKLAQRLLFILCKRGAEEDVRHCLLFLLQEIGKYKKAVDKAEVMEAAVAYYERVAQENGEALTVEERNAAWSGCNALLQVAETGAANLVVLAATSGVYCPDIEDQSSAGLLKELYKVPLRSC